VATTKNPSRTMSQEQTDEMLRREKIVLQERIKGKSFYKIEQEQGFANCDRIFKRAIQREENADWRRLEAIRLEELRIDDLQAGIWDRALTGEPRAVEVALKVLERRARMQGLDFADLVSGQMVEVERAKVRVMAAALVAAFGGIGVTPEQRKAATNRFLAELRTSEVLGTPAALGA
jgi:MFS superfamily sulfate permease-like transporter